ncbi:MAG: sortase, partial [Phoenicibacter congonensis]|nr:sortase [Phoenicibacter congonensis]
MLSKEENINQASTNSASVGAGATSADAQKPQTQSKNKSSVLSLLLIIIVFIAGLSLLLYPLISDLYNTWVHDSMIVSYDEEVSKIPAADYSEWFAKAENYNARLVGQGVPDAFAVHEKTEDEDYTSQLSFREDGMMGYIVIPRIDVNLPIYHYTSDESMQKGVGHLQGSALPVGGSSTHCVLSAHRGLPSA